MLTKIEFNDKKPLNDKLSLSDMIKKVGVYSVYDPEGERYNCKIVVIAAGSIRTVRALYVQESEDGFNAYVQYMGVDSLKGWASDFFVLDTDGEVVLRFSN